MATVRPAKGREQGTEEMERERERGEGTGKKGKGCCWEGGEERD